MNSEIVDKGRTCRLARMSANAFALLAMALPAGVQAAPVVYMDVYAEVSDTACPGSTCTRMRAIPRLSFDGFNGGSYENTTEAYFFQNGTLIYSTFSPGAAPRAEVDVASTSASARAYADLRTGKLGVLASSRPDGLAGSYAVMADGLRFTVAGANADTRTSITAVTQIHAIGNGVLEASYRVCTLGQAPTCRGFSRDWRDTNLTGEILTVPWTFEVVGATQELQFTGILGGIGRFGATIDAINTASISFILPANVTMGSTSGLFLRGGAIPEPSSWAMMIGGLGLIGATTRRRRANVRIASQEHPLG